MSSALEDSVIKTDVRGKASRVLRGGAFSDSPSNVRSASRLDYAPTYRTSHNGLRVARTYN